MFGKRRIKKFFFSWNQSNTDNDEVKQEEEAEQV